MLPSRRADGRQQADPWQVEWLQYVEGICISKQEFKSCSANGNQNSIGSTAHHSRIQDQTDCCTLWCCDKGLPSSGTNTVWCWQHCTPAIYRVKQTVVHDAAVLRHCANCISLATPYNNTNHASHPFICGAHACCLRTRCRHRNLTNHSTALSDSQAATTLRRPTGLATKAVAKAPPQTCPS